MILSKRLGLLAQQYHHEKHIWDIGCDHGLLGLSFESKTSVDEIHLVDPSGPVINILKKQLDAYITKSKIFIHHQSGQEIQLAPLSNLIFIAGMGGKEIHEILLSLIPQMKPDTRLVISPHRNILEVRAFLHQSIYRLENEFLVMEGGRYYQVITLNLDMRSPRVSLYGDSLWRGPLGNGYLDQQLLHFKEHRDGLGRSYRLYLESLKV